jgi:hypothetical protein
MIRIIEVDCQCQTGLQRSDEAAGRRARGRFAELVDFLVDAILTLLRGAVRLGAGIVRIAFRQFAAPLFLEAGCVVGVFVCCTTGLLTRAVGNQLLFASETLRSRSRLLQRHATSTALARTE